MSSPYGNRVLGVAYGQLPHMVADCGRYSVTIRCADTLPRQVVSKLSEISQAMSAVSLQSEEARIYQRRLFLLLESHYDQGSGFAPFACAGVAEVMQRFLKSYDHEDLRLSAWTIMPNHIHLLTESLRFVSVDGFMEVWRRFKGRAAHHLNQHMARSGAFWQSEWYDRLIRDDVEYQKWRVYLAANPVKAGLCRCAEEYPFSSGVAPK